VLAVSIKPASDDAGLSMEQINELFAIIHSSASDYDSVLLANSANLQQVLLVCPSADAGLNAAFAALASVDAAHAELEEGSYPDVRFLLHAANVRFALCGDNERYIPVLLSPQLEQMVQLCDPYLAISSRILLTGSAQDMLEMSSAAYRFIGYTGEQDGEGTEPLYDYYAAAPVEQARLMKHSKTVFEKGVELYLGASYYEAKNIFAQVLRENPADAVARHYIFICERKLQEKGKKDKSSYKPKWKAPEGDPVQQLSIDKQW
jgi:hypothetical protein